jgi:ABC-type multidrug transport system fused ATPase/permease subunit
MVFTASRSGFLFQAGKTIIGGSLPVFISLIWKNILNQITFTTSDITLLDSFILLAIVGGISVSFACFTEFADTLFRNKISLNLQKSIHDKSRKIPLVYYEYPQINDLINRATETFNYGPAVGIMLSISVSVSSLVSMIFSLFVLWSFNYTLVLVFFPLSVPYLLKFYLDKINIDLAVRTSPKRRLASVYSSYFTKYENIKETRFFGMENYFLEKWSNVTENIRQDEYRSNVKVSLFESLIEFFDNFGYVLSILLCVNLFVETFIGIGVFGAVIMLLTQIKRNAAMMWDCLSEVHDNIGLAAKGFEYLDLIEENKVIESTPALVREITGGNLSFTYPMSSRRAIENITISIKRGETVAIVGCNGSGKTTLTKLLLGLYKPDSGWVRYDGIDIASIAPALLYKNVSAVFQDFNHYYLTIRENIGIGDVSNINNIEKVMVAYSKSGGDDFINSLSEGIETPLGKEYGGSELSGGQWQQLALSRCYFRDGNFIILDEPAAALDPFMEARLYENFKRLCHSKIGIIITHRLGAASLADRIILLEDGQIIEQGNHDELCALKGKYWDMFTAQANLYKQEQGR